MIPTSALEAFFRASNPNVDWTAAIAALSQVASAIPTSIVSQTQPILHTTTSLTATQTTDEPSPQKSTPTTEPEPSKSSPKSTSPEKQTLTEPLDVNPISAYRSPGMEEEGGEGEKAVGGTEERGERVETVKEGVESENEEKVVSGETKTEEGLKEIKVVEGEDLNEMAEKQDLQDLMTDDEFQALLEGVQRIEQETVGMAEGPDLASPAVEGEIPKESTEDTERASTQSGARVEEEKEPIEDVIPEKDELKSAKRKLVLKDDPRQKGTNRRERQKYA